VQRQSFAGAGKLTIVGGTNLVFFTAVGTHSRILSVGSANTGSVGEVIVTGTGLLDARTMTDVQVGTLGVGSLTVAGGGQVVLGNLIVGADAATATGTINLTGGSLFVTNSANTAVTDLRANSSFTIQNPAIAVFDKFLSTNSASSITFSGGTLSARQMTISNNATLVVGDGVQTATLNLLGGTHTFASGLTLNTNATLDGAGFSTMTLGGDLNLLSNSTFSVDLSTNSVTLGTGYDRAFVTGLVSVADSTLALNLTSFTATKGATFSIVDNDLTDAISGLFRDTNGTVLTESTEFGYNANGTVGFKIDYFGGTGNDIVLTVVPEPGALPFMGIGLAWAFLFRRRR